MTDLKLLVLGHGTHGKDTVAEMLRDRFGVSFVPSSYACAEKVLMPAFEERGTPYENVEECYADRHNHRGFWHDQIAAYNTPDKSKLCREILEQNNCYVGMRCDQEYAASKHLFDHVLWVYDPRKPLEGQDSFKINQTVDMIQIWNGGSLHDLGSVVSWFAQSVAGLSRIDR